MATKRLRGNCIGFLTVVAGAALAMGVGCDSGSSTSGDTLSDSARAHARDAALGWTATCLGRHQPIHLDDVRDECEHAAKDSSVRVRIEWATANAWGARASKDGVPGDCVYIAGWPAESQYLFTSVEHRGAPLGGAECDGGKTAAARSWPEFLQASFALVLGRELRGVHAYQMRHARAFPPVDSMHLHSDSLIQFRAVWGRPDGVAIEASSRALEGVSCVIWDGALNGHAPPKTAGHQVAQAGIATCDDFHSAGPAKS